MRCSLVVAAFVVVMASPALFAQSASVSQISGTVQDSSGAAVVGAQITVTQVDTGQSRTTQSGPDGAYLLPSLPVGPYRLEVKKDGFATYLQTGIVLQVNTNPSISVALKVGAVTEQVSVEASAAMVEAHSTGVGQVIDQQRVVDLPLNGRQITQLIALAGGATTTSSYQNLNTTKNYPGEAVVSVAGGMLNGLSYLLDGATHNDVFNSLNLPLPFPDALLEFKVETGALQAQYGYHSAGAVDIVTKSGTNQFHGDAFEFVRNRVFNSRDFFALTRDTLKRNQFGGTIGGPIKKNKLFFFAGYQNTTQRSAPNSSFVFVPTAKMLTGDFRDVTQPSCNANKQINLKGPFVDNQISPKLFSAPALKMLTYFTPLPADPCGRVQFGALNNQSEYAGVAKIDYQLSEKHSIFGRYYATHTFVPTSYTGTQVSLVSPNIDDLVNSVVLGDTYIFGPATINSFHASFNRSAVVKDSPPFFTPNDLGISNFTVQLPGFTGVFVSNAFQSACNVCPLGAIFTTTFQVADDFNMVRGAHQIAAGVNWIRPVQHSSLNGSSGGNFFFTGAATNLSMADFMIGALSSFTQTNPQNVYEKHEYLGLYLQDSWKLNPRLALNYGVRWEPYIGGSIPKGRVTHFDQALFNQNVHSTVYPNGPPGILFAGDSAFDTGNRPSYKKWTDFAPRAGVVWDPKGDGKTSIRASWGMFYDLPTTLFWFTYSASPPWGQSITLTNPPGGFADPWLGYPGGNPFPTKLDKNFVFSPGAYYQTSPLDLKPSYVNQWNVSIQRQIGTNWLASVNYLGNNTVHLWTERNLNPAVYIPGTCSPGVYGLIAAGPCSATANTAARRTLTLQNPSQGPLIGSLEGLDDGGTASYQGLLLSLQHRFANHFTVLGNYTYSHCISDLLTTILQGPTYLDPNNRKSDRGDCPAIDVRHIFNLSVVAQSPKFSQRFVQMFAGDWQLSVITNLHSGSPFAVTTGVDNALMGVNSAAGVSNQRPNQVLADPYCPNRGKDCWVNLAAFKAADPGKLGTLGNNNIFGPGYFNVDVGLSRMFPIRERQRIEIRAEAFNLQNRVNFNNPATSVYPNGPSAVMTSNTFGKMTSDISPRIMQFAVKYMF